MRYNRILYAVDRVTRVKRPYRGNVRFLNQKISASCGSQVETHCLSGNDKTVKRIRYSWGYYYYEINRKYIHCGALSTGVKNDLP